jgi:tetratricopeptide (TPR) repeat protein/predicted Ser/Thr protein kinase
VEREPDTVSLDEPGLVSQLALQRARERLLGRTDALSEIGRYRVTHRIGMGGMGVVYAAYDPDLERSVAVKVLRSEAGSDAWLLREAQALARLSHPNVVQIYEVGKHDGHVFIAMELVEGRTLRAWVHTERPFVRQIVARYIDAARGLQAAHAANVLHRDFKPDNALIGRDGRVRVLDFGLARRDYDRTGPHSAIDDWPTAPGSDTRLSVSGTVMGTLRYMPPEQHAGEELGPAADQYAFCASLWDAIVRLPAFPGDDAEALAAAKQLGPPSWPRRARAPRAVVAAIRKGLAPAIEDRWPSMQHLIHALADGISNRRRNRIVFAGTGVFLVAGGVAAASAGTRDDLCTAGAERLGAAWDTQRREAAAEAFAAGPAYAAATWDRIGPRLDAYASAWSEQYDDNCRATRVRGNQSAALMDARSVCLDAARRELEATTALLASADVQTIERAGDLVRGLPPLDPCADAERLLAAVQPPEPTVAAAVAEVRDDVAVATALQRAGKYDEADALLGPAATRMAGVDYPPLHAEVHFEIGMLRERQGRFDEAEAAQTEALRTSLGTGQWDIAVRSASALVIVVGSFAAQPERGLAFGATAWGLLRRTSSPLRLEAELRRSIGAVHRGAANLEASVAELREALRVTLDDPDADPLDEADVRSTLGLALLQAGKHADAQAELRASLAIRTERMGADHPRTATNHQNLGSALELAGDIDGAEHEYEQALRVLIGAHGRQHPRVAMVRGNLANIYAETGRAEEAETENREVLRIFEAVYPPAHPNVISARVNLASTIGAAGRHDEAAKAFEAVVADLKDAGPAMRQILATAHLALNLQLKHLGRVEQALHAAREGLALREQLYDTDHPEVAEARAEVGGALVDLGRPREALELLAAAWRIHAQGGATRSSRADTGFTYAKALHTTGADLDEVRSVAEAARDILGPDADLRAKIDTWLAALR